MSFRNISLLLLIILILVFWLQPDEKQSEVPDLPLEMADVEPVTDEPSEVSPELAVTESETDLGAQCPFPLKQDLGGTKYNLEFESTFDTGVLIHAFIHEIDKLLRRYSTWLSTNEIKGLTIDIAVLRQSEFEEFLIGRVANPSAYSGVYLPAENKIIIKYINDEQATKTLAHEVTHAVNFAIFGYLPRFINEGLAEYSENKQFSLPSHVDKEQLRTELLDFYSLMNSEQDWHTSNNASLYYSGSAWAHFLMESELGNKAIQAMLKVKLSKPCSSLTSELIITTLSEMYPNFEQDFYYWYEEQ